MSLELFEHICTELQKTREESREFFEHFSLTLNHYGEPLLDKYFKERIELLDKYKIDINLYTNATKLDEDKVDFIYRYKHLVQKIDVNMTTLDENEWCETYGLPPTQFKKTFKNLLNLLTTFAGEHNQPKGGIMLHSNLKVHLEDMKIPTQEVQWHPRYKNNRSGNLKINNKNKSNVYEQEYKGNEFLYGCKRSALLTNFSINYEGKVFLCCQDYYQENIIGDLSKNSIKYILNTPEANHLRDQIYGKKPGDNDLICRRCIHSVIDGLDFPLYNPSAWVRN
jgi:radical SAM protein with 4Fe4S-binding SPASM domain